jgi:hypothetical protein
MKIILDSLSEVMSIHGFKIIQKRNTFIKPTKFGHYSMTLSHYKSLNNGSVVTEIGLTLGVRHDEVDSAVNSLGLVYGDDNMKYTCTISRPLEFFPFNSQDRLKFRCPEEINYLRAAVEAGMNDGFTKFYDEFSVVHNCALRLNNNFDKRSHELMNNHEKRIYYGIATALYLETQKFETIKHAWMSVIEMYPADTRKRISERINKLTSNIPEVPNIKR